MTSSIECLSQLLVIEELIAAADWTSTEIVCTEAIADNAHNANFFSNRGIARTHLHRHNEALEDFNLAISIDPINRTAILGRARALLNTGHVDDAGDVVTSVLEDDIGDREAHKLLKDVAVMKFRAMFTKASTSGQRTQLSLLQMSDRVSNEKLNAEEMRLVRLELMRMWCDCIENPGIAPLFIKLIINLIGITCFRVSEYKLSLMCFYLRYIAVLEDPLSTTTEQVIKLRDISFVFIKLGNLESARKIITMAINLDDPVADPEVKLTNQLILCDLQLQAGAIDEPIEKIEQIRKESKERGISRIVVMSDIVSARTKLSIHQVKSGNEILENICNSLSQPGLGALAPMLAELGQFVKAAGFIQIPIPNESEGAMELFNTRLEAIRLANSPLIQNPCTRDLSISRTLNASIGAAQSLMEAFSSITPNDDVTNVNAYQKAQRFINTLTEEARSSHDISTLLLWETISAFTDLMCGRREQANEKFKRCLNLARSNQQLLVLPKICLNYAYALGYQMKLDEALTMSLEAENSYLELYRKTALEDLKITINQEKCLVGQLQTSIILCKRDFVKALYACERYRMPFLRKEIQLPFNEEDLTNNGFVSQLHNYCKLNSSILVYLSDSYGIDMHCWIILEDQICFSTVPLQEGLNPMLEQNVNIRRVMNLQMIGNPLRKFPISNNSNTISEQCQRFIDLASSLLWKILLNKIIFNFGNPKRIVIIPERRLYLIPYALLGNNSASNSLQDYPLLKNFIISQSPSFWALSNTWMKISDTYQDESIEREMRPLALIISNPQSNLPAAEEEALFVTQNLEEHTEFEVLKLIQHLATRDIVFDSLSHSKIVHIASHGNLDADEQHIRAGAIHLADGALYAKEIEVNHNMIFKVSSIQIKVEFLIHTVI